MLKRILSVAAGIAVAMIIISIIEMVFSRMFPAPTDSDFNNAAVLKRIMNKVPIGELLGLLAGYALGSFAGGIVATLISGRETFGPAVITGGVVMIGGIMDLLGIPHPLWFSLVSLLLYVPFPYLGFLVVRKEDTSPKVGVGR